MADAQALIACGSMSRGLILLLRVRMKIGKMAGCMQQRALLGKTEQKCKRQCEKHFMQHDCILSEISNNADNFAMSGF